MSATQSWIDDPFIQAAWATMMFFRHLGFPSKDVYLRYGDNDIYVGLHGSSYPESAAVRIGHHPHLERFLKVWPEVMEAYQEGEIPDQLLYTAWRNSPPIKTPVVALGIIQNMMALGIQIPAIEPGMVDDGTLTPAMAESLLADAKWN